MNNNKTKTIMNKNTGQSVDFIKNIVLFYLIAIAVFVIAASLSEKVYAYETGNMSINKAFLYSLQYNKIIKLEKMKLDIAGYEENEALSGFFPKIDFNEKYLNTNNPLYAFGSVINQKILTNQNVNHYFSPNFLNNPGMIQNYQSMFQVEQPLFVGGKIYLGYQRAKLHKLSLRKSLNEAKQRTLYNVAKAYYSTILSHDYVSLFKNMVKTATAQEKLAKNLYKAGQVVSSDVLRAKVELAKMEEKLATAKKNYRLAKYFLNITIGLPINSAYKLTSDLLLPSNPDNMMPTINTLQKTAFARRPDYKAFLLNKKNMGIGVEEAYGKFLPKVVAGYDYFINGPTMHPGNSYSYAFTIMLHFNIFSGLYKYDNLQRSESRYNTMIEYQGLLRNKIEMQVRKAYLQYKTYLINTRVAKLAVKNAKQTLRITTNRYEAGMTTLINLDATLDQYREANIHYLDTVYKFDLNNYYIKLVTGTLTTKYTGGM